MEPILSVAEAIQTLEDQGRYLAVQLEIEPLLWKVVSLDGEFEDMLTAQQMLAFVRQERAGGGGAA